MRKAPLIIVFSIMAASTVSYGQDTLPGGLGKELQDPKKLKAIIESRDPKYVIVDVRSESRFKRGHIQTAINIPGGNTSNMKNPPEKDRYIIIYCSIGVRSQYGAKKMFDDGYKYVLDWGGIRGRWPYKLEKSE
ncbi:rhodanese-like domain-containing protein [Thermodesulfobacteriota bacterium]